MLAPKDYYAILGVAPTATQEEIRQGFLRKAMENHPDRGGTHEKMVEVSEAIEVLADPRKRGLYDQVRASSENGRNSIILAQWRSAETDASGRARSYPKNSTDFSTWLDAISADVQKTWGGRVLTGFAGGAVFGAVAGFAVSWFMSINIFIGAAIGLAAGALEGAFAGASNDPVTRPKQTPR